MSNGTVSKAFLWSMNIEMLQDRENLQKHKKYTENHKIPKNIKLSTHDKYITLQLTCVPTENHKNQYIYIYIYIYKQF